MALARETKVFIFQGDRMWSFAVGLFLINLSPESLRLTAIYGFVSGGCILLLGSLIGNQVDKKPRLRGKNRENTVFSRANAPYVKS